MKRRAAVILLAFLTMMVCFGMLARAVDTAGITRVATQKPQAQTLYDEAAEEDGSVGTALTEDASDSESGVGTSFPSCVPTTAVYFDGPQEYVYVVGRQAGFSGEEQIAQRVNVTVEASGAGWAALADGALSFQQSVIVRADRALSEGDRVRGIDEQA